VETTIKPSETPTSLVVEGPFRFSRHPMYLGMTAVLIGVAGVLGTLTPWIVVPVFVAAMERVFIRREEAAMQEAFGESYRKYAETVRRWL
jgi:protein-S-isoprenylcysteine O-methyltransferase Ste14